LRRATSEEGVEIVATTRSCLDKIDHKEEDLKTAIAISVLITSTDSPEEIHSVAEADPSHKEAVEIENVVVLIEKEGIVVEIITVVVAIALIRKHIAATMIHRALSLRSIFSRLLLLKKSNLRLY
jgi:hypothetical protein